MNERIWELELQSYVTLTKAGLDGRNEKTTTIFDREKFAELIVRECATMADFADKNPGDYVLKHFGVEEK